MNNTYDSEFSNVAYLEADNVVLLTWKKFCCFDDYRMPTMFASDLLKKFNLIKQVPHFNDAEA